MKSISIMFSGQGAQSPGMGKDLYDASPAAKAIFDRAMLQRLRRRSDGLRELPTRHFHHVAGRHGRLEGTRR